MRSKGSNLSTKGFVGLIIAQFLGAFNDNAFKLVIFLYIGSIIADIKVESTLTSVAAAFFIVPFILLSTYAGWLSDKFSKKSVIVKTKYAEIGVMLFGLLVFMSGSLPLIICALFLMGTQSAFFSPAKYGILPEIVRDDELPRANGHLQMFTFLAIILGTAAGGTLSAHYGSEPYMPSVFFILIALIGSVASLFIQDVKPAKEDKHFEANPIKSAYWTFKNIKTNRTLLYTILAIAFFWFVGALFQLNILIYAKRMMGLTGDALKQQITSLMTRLAFGIGLGSFLAGKLSDEKVEFGIVPLGAVGMMVFCYDLSISYTSASRTELDVFMLGISSGFFIIPLTTYLQQYSGTGEKGENIAFSNLVTFSGIFVASIYLYVMSNVLDVDPAGVFTTMSVAVVIVMLAIFKAIPDTFIRALIWLYIRPRFKVRQTGRSHVPKKSGALIVCNSSSYLDAFLVAFTRERHVTFVVPRRYYNRMHLRWFFRLIKAIPAPKSGTKDFAQALFKARRSLEEGNLVCVFPEGAAVKAGPVTKFSKHLVRLARAKAPKDMASRASKSFPIIPAYIDIPQKSFYGLKKFFRATKVNVHFGNRVKADNVSTYDVKQAVSLLSAEAFKSRNRENDLLHTAFIYTAKKNFFKQYISDSLGFNLSYGSALAGSMAFSKKLNETLKRDEKMVGVLMPTSSIATLLNFSILMSGRVPVNLNYTASKEALKSAVKQCNIQTIFTSGKLLTKLKIKKSEQMLLVEDFFIDIDIVVKIKEFFKALLTPAFILKLKYKNKKRANDIATVIFSSGSTGDPKGVMLTHQNVLTNIEAVRSVLPLEKDEVFCGVLPFFHSFGFMATLALPAVYGYKAVFHPNPVDATHIGKMCEKNKCTILIGTPTFLSTYTRKCTKKNFKSLKLVLAGAEKLSNRAAIAFHDKFGLYPLEGLGCTELSPVISINSPDTKAGDIAWIGSKEGSVGRPLPGVSVKIVDIETHEVLGAGKEGLLLVNGPNLMKGYLNNEKQTQKVIQDGWYNSGDIAKVDEDGFLTITDRLSRFSKIGGEMVPHIKIENKIHEILATDKQVCAVTGVPDGKKGERLVVLYTSEVAMEITTLWDKLNRSGLPKLWIPKKNSFKKIDAIPLLGTGKVALREIKRLAKDE